LSSLLVLFFLGSFVFTFSDTWEPELLLQMYGLFILWQAL
jgi:hypothetical protein